MFLLCLSFAKAAPKLTVTPSVLPADGAPLTLEWSGVPAAKESDIVAIRVNNVQIGYRNVSWTPGWDKGAGKFSLPFPNLRNLSVEFLYEQGGKELASVGLQPHNPAEPTQAHLALTEDPTAIRLIWNSLDPTATNVRWGTKSGHYDGSAKANSSTYKESDLCSKTAIWFEPGLFHDAVLTGLKPSTKYYYQFGGGEKSDWSVEYSFWSPPLVGADVNTNAFLFGDLGVSLPFTTREEQQPPAEQTLQLILKDVEALSSEGKPAFIHLNGDVSYARGYAYLWDWFSLALVPTSTQVPWMVSIGNHEYDYPGQEFKPSWADYGTDSGGECGVPYNVRYHMPGPVVGSRKERNLWFSYEFGNVHYTAISLEHNFTENSPQYVWLKQDLLSVDRKRTPWVIVLGHRPMYSSWSGYDIGKANPYSTQKGAQMLGNGISDHLRWSLEPLFIAGEVDVAVWGHIHVYERTCRISQLFKCAGPSEHGTVHLTLGMAGNVYQGEWADSLPRSERHSPHHHAQPEWSIFRSDNYGYGRLRTEGSGAGNRKLIIEYVGDSSGGAVHDTLVLTK